MRDSRKFCFPKSIKTPQEGDVLITLKNGKLAYISFLDLGKVKNIIKNYVILEDERKYSKQYLTFEALEDTTFTFSDNALQYSLDGGTTWTTLPADTATPTVTKDNKILWKQTGLMPESKVGIGRFSATGNFKAYGNIMSLYYGDNFTEQTDLTGKDYAFNNLFSYSTTLINAENLILPATTLASKCYASMFFDCTSLVTAPELPATTLAESCYLDMFQGCTALTSVTELPATILTSSCYASMFQDCTSLTTAPTLLATTLAEGCYNSMFFGCTSLVTAPELPATILANYCYNSMFKDCTSLTTAPLTLPATTLVHDCYYHMFDGCTSLTSAPKLPATTLAYNCYNNMFSKCTSLLQAPELPAAILVSNCYAGMFEDCTSLNYIKCLATDISAEGCTNNWVQNIAAAGTFVKDENMIWPTESSGIPSGWIVESA